MPAWNDQPQVLSPVGRSFAEIMEEGPRRQELPRYDPVYRDFVDYIMRCTHRIWEEKNIGLCRTHYGEDCVMHTLAGPQVGYEIVVQNTIGALAMSSDRQVIGEDVIWSDEGIGNLYSSHRIVSSSTHLGDDAMLGPATRREAGVMTIADCLCRENRIVEEWLVRDNLRAVWQVGGNPWDVAASQATDDKAGDQERHRWRAEAIEAVRQSDGIEVPSGHPANLPVAMLKSAVQHDLYGDAAKSLSPSAEIRWPSNRRGWGRGYWIGCLTQIRAVLHRPAISIDHVAARPLPDDDIAVAVRWSLTGTHGAAGIWGEATGKELLIMAVSHYRIRSGLIVEDLTIFDELAVLRQVLGGLGA
ncbi:MAG: ester cyclase [Pontixanthobacter sp.]